MPRFDVDAAVADGKTIPEIASFLSETHQFDYNKARYDGISDEEIVGFLRDREVAPEPESTTDKAGAVGDIVKFGLNLPTRVKGAIGNVMTNDKEIGTDTTWERWAREDEELTKQRKAEQGSGASKRVFEDIPITRGDIADAESSSGFSVVAGGPSAVAEGIRIASNAIPNPAGKLAAQVGSVGLGMAGSFDVARRADKNMFTRQLLDKANADLIEARGEGMNQSERSQFLLATEDLRNQHGLWEAGPEAIGNAIGMFGIGKIIAGAAGGKIGKALTGYVLNQLGEHSTETITGTGQQRVEVEAGMQEGHKREWNVEGLTESFKEQAPVTTVLGTVMGGGAASVGGGYRAAKGMVTGPGVEDNIQVKNPSPYDPAQDEAMQGIRVPDVNIPPVTDADFAGRPEFEMPKGPLSRAAATITPVVPGQQVAPPVSDTRVLSQEEVMSLTGLSPNEQGEQWATMPDGRTAARVFDEQAMEWGPWTTRRMMGDYPVETEPRQQVEPTPPVYDLSRTASVVAQGLDGRGLPVTEDTSELARQAEVKRGFLAPGQMATVDQEQAENLYRRRETDRDYQQLFGGASILPEEIERKLYLLERQMDAGEVGQRFQKDDGTWDGVKSTNPGWLKTGPLKDAGKAGVKTVISKVRNGEALTNRQQFLWSEIQKAANIEYENDPETIMAQEAARIEKEEGISLAPPSSMQVGELGIGDKAVVVGKNGIPDVVEHKGYDDDGKAILKDGVTIHADPWDTVYAMGVKKGDGKADQEFIDNELRKAEEQSQNIGRSPSLFGQSSTPATRDADTGAFLRDQKIRSGAVGRINQPVRRVPGESPDAYMKRRREELEQRKAFSGKAPAMIDIKAHEAALSPKNDLQEPTDGQKEAGNYRKGHVRLHGLDISIENPAGSTRSGVDQDGKRWETPMRDHYGYIKGTVGKDKDHIDLFIPEGFTPAEDDMVAMVDQVDPKTGKFDEHKVVMGSTFLHERSARETYLRNYDKTGKDRIGAVTVMPVKDFKRWLESGDTKKPVGDISGKAERLSFPQKGKAATVEADTAGFLRDQEGRKEYAGRVREPLRKEPGETVDQFMARRREVMRQRKEWSGTTVAISPLKTSYNNEKEQQKTGSVAENATQQPKTSTSGESNGEERQGQGRQGLLEGSSIESELAASSDEDLAAMMDDVFGEKKKPSPVARKKRVTPREKFSNDLEMKGFAVDPAGTSFKVVEHDNPSLGFSLEITDKEGRRSSLGNPMPGGWSMEEARARAIQKANFAVATKPKTAKAIAKEGGIAALDGVKLAMEGLNALFGSGNMLASGLAFDEETYAKAKPHFIQAWNNAKQVGYSLKELVQYLHDQFGKAIRPYLERFLQDVRSGNLTLSEDANTVKTGDIAPTTATGEAKNDNIGTGSPELHGEPIRENHEPAQKPGDKALVGMAAEVRQGSDQAEPAADDSAGSGGAGTKGNQGADGLRVPASRGRRGRSSKVHPETAGAGSDSGDGGSGSLKSAPATIPAKNFVITEDVRLGEGGEAQKFKDNIAAIRILNQLAAEKRRATPEEQKALARYVGWGGIPNAFRNAANKEQEIKPGWEDRVADLEGILSKEDLATARNSTQNAHYTSGIVVSAMWEAVKRLGFKGGIALEPSVGTGNFLGLLPEDLAGSTKFIASEFDGVTAGIAKALYPQEGIFHTPFEKMPIPSEEFDLVIGNPPFGRNSLVFPNLPSVNGHSMHNQFFLAGLDALKPGGIQAFVVSRYLMDSKDSTVRKELARQARFLGAVRLPDTAFKENARTEVVTDIIFLQKRVPEFNEKMEPILPSIEGEPWIESVDVTDSATGEPMGVNAYFTKNPGMVLGKIDRSGSMRYEGDITVRYHGNDFAGDLKAALDKALPAGVAVNHSPVEESEKRHKLMTDSIHITLSGEEDGSITIDPANGNLVQVREARMASGSYILTRTELTPETPWHKSLSLESDGRWVEEVDKVDEKGNKVKKIVNGRLTKLNDKELKYYSPEDVPKNMRLGETNFSRIKDAIGLLESLKKQIQLESSTRSSDKEIEANRKELKGLYEDFVKNHKYHLNSSTISSLFSDMPNGALLVSLEHSYQKPISKEQAKKTGMEPRKATAEMASILTKRVIFPYVKPEKTSVAHEALAVALSEAGKVDMDMISELMGKDQEDIIARLHDNLEEPLIFKDPETGKWETADEYIGGNVVRKLNAAKEAGMEKNIASLEKIQPEPWGADKVTVIPGATWVPENVYADFMNHLTGAPATVRFIRATNTFAITRFKEDTNEARKWSTDAAGVRRLAESLLNSKTVRITYTDSQGKVHVDADATEAANMKVAEIKEEFSAWVFKDSERRAVLVDLFNKKYNVRVTKQRNGQHLTFPGKVPDSVISLRRHQKNAIWRGVVDQAVLYDHAVGAGKTFTGIARAMERRRMGLSRKPMIVVPNHLVEQFAADVYRLYPGAKVLAAGRADLSKNKRRRLFARIATGDWDVVIVPHSSFAFIGIDPTTETRYLEEELKIAEEAVKEAEDQAEEDGLSGWRKPLSVKQAEALRDGIMAKLKKLKERGANKDRLLTFEQMGVDDLTVDEAHEFKNLFYTSNMQARGMNPKAGSAKAYDLWTKTRILREKNGSIAFMTGTPISNSAVEMYGMMRYLAADDLQDMGIEHFDAWRTQFVDATTEFEPTESGRGLKEVNRLGRDWSNMRSLMDLYYSFADCVSNDDIKRWYKEDKGEDFPIPVVKAGGRVGINIKPTEAQKAELDRIVAGFEGLDDIKDVKVRNATRLRLMDQARKVSLDARTLNPSAGEEKGGKLQVASEKIFEIYQKWNDDKGTQLVFLDRSVPKSANDRKVLDAYDDLLSKLREAERTGDVAAERRANEALEKYDANEMEEIRSAQTSPWNGYQQIKDNLVAMGIPANEIRFVQEANTDEQKQTLFDEVKSGNVRVLIGSTPRMGAGTNVQDRLVALHHVDVTWKPSDIEQREGRIIRQGNKLLAKYGLDNFQVEINAYTTESTIDAKLWSLNATKLKMINGIRQYNGEFNMEFDDEESVGMAEIAAIASGDPLQLERVKVDAEIKKLERQQKAFNRQMWSIKDEHDYFARVIRDAPSKVDFYKSLAPTVEKAIAEEREAAQKRTIKINGKDYTFLEIDDAYQALRNIEKESADSKEKFSVEIDGEKTRSKDKAFKAIEDKLGDASTFDVVIDGEHFISRDAARRKVAAMANKAMEGQPDDLGERELGTITIHGVELNLSFETEAITDRRGEPVKAVSFYFEKESKGENGAPMRISAHVQGSVLKINNQVNINSITDLFNKIVPEIRDVPSSADHWQAQLEKAEYALPALKEQAEQPFPKAQELAEKRARLAEVESELSTRTKGSAATETEAAPTVEPIEGPGPKEARLSVASKKEEGSTIAQGRSELSGQYNPDRVTIVQSESELPSFGGDSEIRYAVREKQPPKKTVKAYKLFRVDKRFPGKLFPLFVDANTPISVMEWLDAESGIITDTGKVKSKLGPLAYRPGWHAGDLPLATHIGKKANKSDSAPSIRNSDHVWAEVELAADVDWQEEANKRGTNKDGKVVGVKAHITDQVPVDGFYRYKTNPNMTGSWLISGAMKVNRVLSDQEVQRINDAAGTSDLQRETPFDASLYGFDVLYSNNGRVQGAYLPGQDRTFLVADNISTGEWSRVLHHEGFHRAMASGSFSDVFSELERMEKMYTGSGQMAKWFEKAREKAQVDRGKPHYIEEIGAYAVSQYHESPNVIKKWVDRLVAKLRMFLRQIGVKVNLTPAMLREIAARGLRAKSVDIDQGAVTGEMEPAVAYSQTDPVSLENLEAVTSDMARAAKKGSIKFIKSDKKDSSFLERLLSTPEYYFKKTSAAAGRVLQAALLRRDVRFQKQKEILGDFVSFVQDLRKTDMPAYQEANEYLIDTDQVGGFSIKETEDGWVVMSRDGKKEVSTHPTDKEAQVALVEAEANDLKSQGYSDKAVEAVKMARALTNRAFDVMAEDMRRIIQEAADNGRPNPFIGDGKIDEAGRYGVYAKGQKKPVALFRTEQEAKESLAKIAEFVSYSVISAKGDVKYFTSVLKAKKWAARRGGNFEMTKRFANLSVKKRTDAEMRPMTVKEALAQMGDLRGSYFPRIRENGEYVLIARKDGENQFRQNFDLPGVGDGNRLQAILNSVTPIGRKARALKAQGYDVTISKDTKPTDDVFDATNLITSLDAILQESMGELNKNDSDEVKAAQVVDQIITMQIADIFKARGYLASRMKRLSGDEVWEGYETDMGKALTQYGKNIAAGTAKRDTARAMVLAFTGRDYTWQQYKSEVEKPSWEEYKKIVEDRRIDPGKQKNLFKDVRGFIVDVLRNDEQTDRIVGTLKGLAVHKFLGFRISSAAVNATNMVTGVVGTMSGKTGESLNRSLRRVMAAATAYTKYRSGVGSISNEDRAIFLEITSRGWDEAQFDHEAMSELRSKMGDVWNKYEAASMFMFGAVEKANRAMTIFAALKAVRAKHPTMDEKLQWDMAKEISDTSHGTYGKETLPAMARGGDLNRMLRMPLTFTKFTHNYMLNMIDLGFNKRQWKAASYLLLSPALIAGSGATLAAPLVFALAGALGIGGDDPEEEFYKWSANTFGTDAFARHGLAGLAGVNIKGSLAINMPMPADISKLKLVDIFGPVGGVVGDVAKGAASLAQGDVAKGVELLLPTAFGSMSKAFREHREGVTTSNYGSVFYGDEPLKADELDAALRFLSFNPSRISGIREKQWNEKEVAAKYQERKTAIYHDIKRDHLHGRGLTPEILKEIKRYNELVDGSGRSDISKITPKSIRTMLKRNAKPQKRELERASAMR